MSAALPSLRAFPSEDRNQHLEASGAARGDGSIADETARALPERLELAADSFWRRSGRKGGR